MVYYVLMGLFDRFQVNTKTANYEVDVEAATAPYNFQQGFGALAFSNQTATREMAMSVPRQPTGLLDFFGDIFILRFFCVDCLELLACFSFLARCIERQP